MKILKRVLFGFLMVVFLLTKPAGLVAAEADSVIGGYYSGDVKCTALQSIDNYGSQISYVFVFSVGFSGLSGNIRDVGLDSDLVKHAREKNTAIVAVLSSAFFSSQDKQKFHTLLATGNMRTALIKNLSNYIHDRGLNGLQLDIEGIAPSDRALFTKFVGELAKRLHADKKLLFIAVPPKQRDGPDLTWSYAYDYGSLSNIADYIIVMAYGEHDSNDPGPVASYGWVDRILKFTASVANPKHVLAGIGTYGEDYTLVSRITSKMVTYSNICAIPQLSIIASGFDNVSRVPYLNYMNNGQKHEVWYENEQSLTQKLNLRSKYNLAGIAFFLIGSEDPAIWRHLGKSVNSNYSSKDASSKTIPLNSVILKSIFSHCCLEQVNHLVPKATLEISSRFLCAII